MMKRGATLTEWMVVVATTDVDYADTLIAWEQQLAGFDGSIARRQRPYDPAPPLGQ